MKEQMMPPGKHKGKQNLTMKHLLLREIEVIKKKNY